MCDVGLVASRIWFGWLLYRNQYLRLFRFPARKMAQDHPQTTHGSTAYGVHRTKPNVSEDLLMDLKCQDSRESWNNKRILVRLPISRSWGETPTPTVSFRTSARFVLSEDNSIYVDRCKRDHWECLTWSQWLNFVELLPSRSIGLE
jgi:hypothetical protein